MLGGLDIGTTGCKVVIYDDKGHQLYRSYKSYETKHINGKDELDILDILAGVDFTLKDALSKYPEVEGIAIDTFGEAFVLLDDNDKPLAPIITCTDSRGEEEVNKLVSILGEKPIELITGLKPATTYSYGKLIWFKNNEPKLFSKCKHLLLMEDAIIYYLTGNNYIDYSLASRTMMFDVNKLEWSKQIIDIESIDTNILSKPVPFGTKCGSIKSSIQNKLEIKTNVEIVTGGHDQITVAMGSGVFKVGSATDGAGTVECISAIFNKDINKLDLINNNYALVPFLDSYITYAFSYTSGSLIDWYIKNILKVDDADIFEKLEQGFKDGPSGILVLPHFAGAACPYMDNKAKGCFVGLTLGTTQSEMYQGILEGIAYEMRLNNELLSKCGVHINELCASGGGSKSKKWLQIKSDILNLPIKTLEGSECGTRGCAMIAGVALGKFKDYSSANDIFIKYKDIILPNAQRHIEYSKQYKKYARLYKSMKEVLYE